MRCLIQKKFLEDVASNVVRDEQESVSPHPQGEIAKLLNNIVVSKQNSSKVVDENGEPMVVYHQTNSKQYINRETGENWEDLDWRERDEWEARDDWEEYWEEQDFYKFDNKNHDRRSVEMPAIFFSPVEDPYHEYGERTIATFLNVRNPAINPTIENAGATNTAGEEAMNRLIAEGHDGFFRIYEGEDKETWEYNAFYPNQIKSATENNGEFSREKDDIRYRILGEDARMNGVKHGNRSLCFTFFYDIMTYIGRIIFCQITGKRPKLFVSLIEVLYLCDINEILLISLWKAITTRKPTMLRLRVDLLERLKDSAKKANRSLNNYIESVLLDIEYNEPNEETKAAIEEARRGESVGTLDMSSFKSFMRDVNAIE